MSIQKKKILTILSSILCLFHPHGAVATDIDMDVWHDDIKNPAAMRSVDEMLSPTPEPIPLGVQAVEIAKQYIGVPYVWGGTDPSGFDCSGLMQYVYKQLDISISRTTSTQINDGRAVSRDELALGDLILFGHPVHHVGMYVGDGNFIEAPYSGERVKITPLSNRDDYNCARRIVE